ncbi:MAG: DEAD/DEAH box helicase [Deinococcus sp.]|nr:DEAD/DEAH box helicase [Deinococcus sp.]
MGSTITDFHQLGLSAEILRDIGRAGFTTPTPVQAQAIPPALQGSDVIGCAQTGTGKTAAFVIPMVERLADKAGVRGLILAPTRELAIQIQQAITQLGTTRRVRAAIIVGGVAMGPQVQTLRHRPHIIVATPGRLLDHMGQGTVRLNDIEMLVLDEADRMLDMGFAPQLERILRQVPQHRQTLLFSATIPAEIAALAKAHLRQPVRVNIGRSATPAERATHQLFAVGGHEKTALLLALLKDQQGTVLVFTRTKHRADRVAHAVQTAGHRVACIHANRSQSQRQEALAGFKSGKYQVLVATDIAARGIDVANIAHVINYDLPNTAEDYVHRIGRTARVQASGLASSFASPEEREQLWDIERLLGKPVPRAERPASLGPMDPALTLERPMASGGGQRPHRFTQRRQRDLWPRSPGAAARRSR